MNSPKRIQIKIDHKLLYALLAFLLLISIATADTTISSLGVITTEWLNASYLNISSMGYFANLISSNWVNATSVNASSVNANNVNATVAYIANNVIEQGSLTEPASYIIFTDGTYYYAKNGTTGAIDFGGPNNLGGANGTNASAVIQSAINSVTIGGLIHIAAGQYALTSQLTISKPLILEGEGRVSNGVQNMATYGTTLSSSAGTGNAAIMISAGYCNDLESVTIRDLGLRNTGSTDWGINAKDLFYSHFQDLSVVGFVTHGIFLTVDCGTTYSSGNEISDSVFITNAHSISLNGNSAGARVEDVDIHNNWIQAGTAGYIGIHDYGYTDSITIRDNTIVQYHVNWPYEAISIDSDNGGTVIYANNFEANTVDINVGANAIWPQIGPNNRIVDDSLPITVNSATPNVTIFRNPKYNPLGKISNPVGNVTYTIGPFGNTSTVSASTDYVATGVDLLVTSTGGTGVNITLKDPSGNAIATSLPNVTAQYLPIGYKINFGAFSVAPTVTVFGN